MINLSCHWTRGWVLSYFETCGPEATIWPTDRDQTLATNLLLVWKHDTGRQWVRCRCQNKSALRQLADSSPFCGMKTTRLCQEKTVLCTHPFHFYVCAYNEEFRFYSSSEFAQLWVGQRKANTSCLRLAIREWLREQKHKTTNMSQLILCNATMICNEHNIF